DVVEELRLLELLVGREVLERGGLVLVTRLRSLGGLEVLSRLIELLLGRRLSIGRGLTVRGPGERRERGGDGERDRERAHHHCSFGLGASFSNGFSEPLAGAAGSPAAGAAA